MRNILSVAMVMGALAMAWGSVGEALAATPQQFRYHYVSLNTALPPGFERFIPLKITEDRRVYGSLLAKGCTNPFACPATGVHRNGRATVISRELMPSAANEHGVVGGGVVTNAENGEQQAALIEGGKLKRLPRQRGEITSFVQHIADSGLALVASIKGPGTGYRKDYYYYCRGRIIGLPLLTNLDVQGINSHGLAAGSRRLSSELDDVRAFRFRTPTTLGILAPAPPYASSWAFGINDRGDVVGYQDGPFVSGEPAKQRVGFWRGQKFETYFVQGGTTGFPERTQTLVANERGLIVASPDFVFGTAFILPWPGLRIPLPEITDEKVFQLWFPTDVNNRGDVIGLTAAHDGSFLTSSGLFQRVTQD